MKKIKYFNKINKIVLLTAIVFSILFLIYQNNKIRFYYEYLYHNYPFPFHKIDLEIDDFFDDLNIFKKFFYSRQDVKRIDIKMSSDDLKNFHDEKDFFLKLGYQKGELKNWRKVKILIDGKKYKAKIKLHGNSSTPLIKKFSFQIKLDKEGNFYNGQKRFKLIYAKTEIPFSVIVPNHLAKTEKLYSPIGEYKNVYVNGVFYGSYYLSDMLSKEVLETDYGITDYAIFKPNDDWDRMTYGHSSNIDIEAENMEIRGTFSNESQARARIQEFFKKIKNGSVFKDSTLTDQDYFAKFLALQALTSESHNAAGDNLKLLLNLRDGKIYPIFRNEGNSSERLIKIPGNPYKSIEKFNLMWLESYYTNNNDHLYINDAPAMELYRLYLRNGFLRSKRDKFIQSMIEEKKYDQIFQNIYDKNAKVLLSGDISSRYLNYDIWASRRYIEKMYSFAKNYINYSKLFVSHDNEINKVNILSDSFQPLRIEKIKYLNNEDIEKEVSTNIFIQAPNLDNDMKIIIDKTTIDIDDDIKNILQVSARNLTNDKMINDDDIYLSKINLKNNNNSGYINTLINNQIKYSEKLLENDRKNIEIKSGKYNLKNHLIFDSDVDVNFESDVNITMDENIVILIRGNVSFKGTENLPISFTEKDSNNTFGSIIIMGGNGHTTSMENVIIKGGKDTYFNGIHSSAALMIHDSDVVIKNLKVSNSQADDGLNVRFSKIDISNSYFINNFYDQVDLDFCEGVMHNNLFNGELNENGDGLDLSGSVVKINNNKFDTFVDKALSIGEKSEACIENNLIKNSHIGIASKDGSNVYSFNNSYENVEEINKTYLKKKMYQKPGSIIEESCSF